VWHDWHFFENVIANIISHFYLLTPPPPLISSSSSSSSSSCFGNTPWGTPWEPDENLLGTCREHIGNKGKTPPKKFFFFFYNFTPLEIISKFPWKIISFPFHILALLLLLLLFNPYTKQGN
jgi:hypothetical protein